MSGASVPYPHRGTGAPQGAAARDAHVARQVWSALFPKSSPPDVVLANAPGRVVQSGMITYPLNPGGVPRVYTGANPGLADPNVTSTRPNLIHEYAHVMQNWRNNANVPLTPVQRIEFEQTPIGHLISSGQTNPYVEAGAEMFRRLVATRVLGGLGFQHNAVHTNDTYNVQVDALSKLLGPKGAAQWALGGQFNNPNALADAFRAGKASQVSAGLPVPRNVYGAKP